MWKRPELRRARIISRIGHPPVLVGAGFAAIVAAIVGNALLLQPDRHPAPLFATRSAENFAAPAPEELVRAIQASLQETGYYAGPVDGLLGPQTQAAIKEFERRSGRPMSGEPSEELLAAIRSAWLVPPTPRPVTAAADAAAVMGTAQVAAVQDALARAAYGPLLADGVIGRQTREAIMRFQRDHGLPVTGEIDDALVAELRASGALGGD